MVARNCRFAYCKRFILLVKPAATEATVLEPFNTATANANRICIRQLYTSLYSSWWRLHTGSNPMLRGWMTPLARWPDRRSTQFHWCTFPGKFILLTSSAMRIAVTAGYVKLGSV
jgi:hypothetical protein